MRSGALVAISAAIQPPIEQPTRSILVEAEPVQQFEIDVGDVVDAASSQSGRPDGRSPDATARSPGAVFASSHGRARAPSKPLPGYAAAAAARPAVFEQLKVDPGDGARRNRQ